MRKKAIILAVFWLFVVLTPSVSKAEVYPPSQKTTGLPVVFHSQDASESSLSRSFWDWLTTLGKSPQEKQRIKSLHKAERTQKRFQQAVKLREKEQLQENEARKQEEERIREARIRAKRKRIEQKRRQMKKVNEAQTYGTK